MSIADTIRHQETITIDVLNKAANTLEWKVRDAVQEIICSAQINADDTIQEGADPKEWDYFFRASLEVVLSFGEYGEKVEKFFKDHGITY